MNEKIRQLSTMLEEGVNEYFQSGSYTRLLDVMSRFHTYSFGNCILIAMQKPSATYVAGYTAWKTKFHRQVRKAERCIRIISPTTRKTEKADGTEITTTGFKSAVVFDISQTDPIPTMTAVPIGVPALDGDIDNYTGLISAFCSVSPVPIDYEHIDGGAHGYYSESEQRIVIADDLSQLHTAHTVLHEICHAKIHNKTAMQSAPKDRHTMETEAESVAYICCQHFGFDTSSYSFPYIASWSGKEHEKLLRSSMITIQKTADEIITAVEEELAYADAMRDQFLDMPFE